MNTSLRHFKDVAVFLAVTLLILILAGCGSSPQQPPPPPPPPPQKKVVPKFVYVANYGSDSVSAFSVTASTGNLSPVPGSPFPTDSEPFSLVLDSSAKFLYVINHGAFEISVYGIGQDGGLSKVSGSPFFIAPNPNGAVLSPSGKFLYVTTTDSGAGQIWKYSIDSSTGLIDPSSATSFPAGTLPVWLALDRTGKFLFASDIAAGQVLAFSVDQSSEDLHSVAGSPFTTGVFPNSVLASPSPIFSMSRASRTMQYSHMQSTLQRAPSARLGDLPLRSDKCRCMLPPTLPASSSMPPTPSRTTFLDSRLTL